MRTKIVQLLLLSLVSLGASRGASAQIGVGISVSFGPPPLPVYEQPICPAAGYLWTPGYWAYDDDDGYYWVPGTWVEAPQVGFLWTPGYWGWNEGAYIWNEGYWGPEVGFYGGINYGFGYFGTGFGGGEWRGNSFYYNTAVVHVNEVNITNVYVNKTVIVNNDSHVAFNGGQGGIQARPSAQEEAYAHQTHTPPVSAQMQHVQEARNNPQLRASANHGKPPIAATAKPGDFEAGAVAAGKAGGKYKTPPPNTAHGNGSQPGDGTRSATENHPENTAEDHPSTYTHASELQPQKSTPPNTGDAATDKKYQQQQDKLAAKQAQERQKLQQQQEKDHQLATKKNYNDTQKQQMEQQHAQQTQQLAQKHTAQQKELGQRQAPKQTASTPDRRPAEEKPH
jgi:WXXGXW repeat (2 copies)